MVSGLLGRLLHGLPAVRMTNSTSVCVASDSTNQPVWNSRLPSVEHAQQHDERQEVESELTGPMKSMNRGSAAMSQRRGFWMKPASTWSVGMVTGRGRTGGC